MNVANFFEAAERLPVGTLTDVTGGGGLVVVAPHPDDESLGCGGLIAAACAEGTAVRLIVVSDGAGSHPNSKLYPPDRLRDLREEETCHASVALGLDVSAIRFLRLPDRHVPSAGTEAQAACDAILEAVREIQAGAVCVTWAHDPHCDHSACAALVALIHPQLTGVNVFAYPVWGWTLPSQTDVGPAPAGLRFTMHRYAGAKAKAIAAHRSQTTDLIDDDPDGFRISSEMIARFSRDYELLLKVEPARPERHKHSLPAAYFDEMYARDLDPWQFTTSPYEQAKYDATLAALPRARYASALEVGCSIGVLTHRLSCRVDKLDAIDVSASALDQAKRRCSHLRHVRFDLMRVPAQWPAGRFDLTLLSEVLYYFDRGDVAALAERVRASIMPGGDIVLVHWLGATHYPLSGDEAAELFMASTAAWAAVTSRSRTRDYRLDVLQAVGSP